MDFSLSEAQTEIAGLARKILAERDSAAQRQWADLAAAGVLAAGLPESLGGAGLGFLEQCSVLAEAGRAASPAALSSVDRARRGRDRRVRHRGPAAPVGRARRGRLAGDHRRAGGRGQRRSGVAVDGRRATGGPATGGGCPA